MSLLSSARELDRIATLLGKYTRLPFCSPESVPGAAVMAILAEVRNATLLETYDFVDVVRPGMGIGWQVKSTKAGTPVTWKRAKIPDKIALIEKSRTSAAGVQSLGDAIIDFCNQHVAESFREYGLQEIGYSRLVVHSNNEATYFEKVLVSRNQRQLFDPRAFRWAWSTPKKTVGKEQLQALHGLHVTTGRKWWAWHGLGENQLHFSGESAWWPDASDPHRRVIRLPQATDRMTMQDFIELLE